VPGGPATLLASPNTTDLRWESWEYGACKHILYRTVGGYSEPESGFKVFDICCFVPSLLFLLFLLYSLPRTRQKLAGSPLLFLAVHALLGVTAAASLLRCILMFLAPSPNKDGTAAGLEVVGWAGLQATLAALELTALTVFWLRTLPAERASKRLVGGILVVCSLLGGGLALLELSSPDPRFLVIHLDRTPLYGSGGATAILLGSLLAAAVYSALISARALQPGKQRSSTFTYCCVMLGVSGSRALGGILLAASIQFGFCLTSLTLYLQVCLVPPLVWLCLLCPLLQLSQGHSLLGQRGMTSEADWLEAEDDLFSTQQQTYSL